MNINSNGNVVRTTVKVIDSKGSHRATFATGNRWSDGKLSVSKIITLLRAPQVSLRGEINDKGKFIVGVSYNGELYGFLNSPIRDGSLNESDLDLIQAVRLNSKSRIEEVVSQQARIAELDALEQENSAPVAPKKKNKKQADTDDEPAF